MASYLYRTDSEGGLRKLVDGYFRARRWHPPPAGSYDHALLAGMYPHVEQNAGLFRLCFYSSRERAEPALVKVFDDGLGPRRLLRCPHDQVLRQGFFESWDDAFKLGDAYLFWTQEVLARRNQEWSSAGVPLEHFQILDAGLWRPFQAIHRELTTGSIRDRAR